MDRESKISCISDLFRQWAGTHPETVLSLPLSGSKREYFRLSGSTLSAIGAYNQNPKENRAFLDFTRHFRAHGLPVPEIYGSALENDCYLVEDLGQTTLHKYILEHSDPWSETSDIPGLYREAIFYLIDFQLSGLKNFDYSLCVPRPAFDRQSILWDLNYFKYLALKLHDIDFDEQLLEEDFHRLAEYLTRASSRYFLYRDFQSRNIMVREGKLCFIDYQGGRRGALQYDLATLLYQSRIDMPPESRDALREYYLEEISKKEQVNRTEFMKYYYGFVLIRLLQVLGTYGLRGIVENMGTFLAGIPYALNNLHELLASGLLNIELPELDRSVQRLVESNDATVDSTAKGDSTAKQGSLHISINSFSYRKGIPRDNSGHGGGFVFDCRALPNPGRIESLKSHTGKDRPVIEFLDGNKEVSSFLNHVNNILHQAVKDYQQRHFNHLMISFGCTGGQHRSVYCAEKASAFLKRNFDVGIRTTHRELS